MERITFDQLPEMVALLLEKVERLEALLTKGGNVDHYLSKDMLTVDEAAQYIGASKSTMYKMSFNRDLPVYKPTGGRIYFKKADLAEHLQQNQVMSRHEIEQEALNYVVSRPQKRKALRM